MKNAFVSLLVLAFATISVTVAIPVQALAQSVQRPPQFILLSYDGSYNLEAWEAIRAVSNSQRKAGIDTRFTFFASGVYFLQSSLKTMYQAPGKAPGRSDIGFGGQKSEIELRIDEMNRAFSEGNEIGSHVNGHFNGSKWSFDDWMSEFNQFENLIFNVFSINKINPNRGVANGWLFKKENVRGFRAPLLGTSPGLWQTLAAKNYAYDCSRTAPADYWPEKLSSGLWNFPLASLRIAGTNKKTLSMDYNFYANQSGAVADLNNKELYSKQMYETYISWFQKNYNGGRAPMNIGHHFSSWNGGAYFSALNRFALKVCGLPEVRCITYSEYIKWLESQPAATLASYKKGQFPKAASVEVASLLPQTPAVDGNVKVALTKSVDGHDYVYAKSSLASAAGLDGLTARLSVDGKMLNYSYVSLDDVRALTSAESVKAAAKVTAHLYNVEGIEVARSTQTLNGLQSEDVTVSTETEEDKALQGDLPQAHLDEHLPFVVPNF